MMASLLVYKIVWIIGIAFTILPHYNLGLLSDYKICGNSECESLMSRVLAIRDYHSKDCRFLSFRQGDTIFVYYKLTGKREDLWAGSIDKQFGYFPKDAVTEEQIYTTKEIVLETQKSDFFCLDEYGYPIDSSELDSDEDDQKIQIQEPETTQTISSMTESPSTESYILEQETNNILSKGDEEKYDGDVAAGMNEEAHVAQNKQDASPSSSWIGSSVTGWLGLLEEEEPASLAEGEKIDKSERIKEETQGDTTLTSSVTGLFGFGGNGEPETVKDSETTQDTETSASLTSTMTGWLGFGGETKKDQSVEKEEEKEEERKTDEGNEPLEVFRSRKLTLDLEGNQLHAEERKETGTLDWLGSRLSSRLGFGPSDQDLGHETTTGGKAEEMSQDEQQPVSSSWLDIGIDILGFRKDEHEADKTTGSRLKDNDEVKMTEEPRIEQNSDASQSQPPLTGNKSTDQMDEKTILEVVDNSISSSNTDAKISIAEKNQQHDSPTSESSALASVSTDGNHNYGAHSNTDSFLTADPLSKLVEESETASEVSFKLTFFQTAVKEVDSSDSRNDETHLVDEETSQETEDHQVPESENEVNDKDQHLITESDTSSESVLSFVDVNSNSVDLALDTSSQLQIEKIESDKKGGEIQNLADNTENSTGVFAEPSAGFNETTDVLHSGILTTESDKSEEQTNPPEQNEGSGFAEGSSEKSATLLSPGSPEESSELFTGETDSVKTNVESSDASARESNTETEQTLVKQEGKVRDMDEVQPVEDSVQELASSHITDRSSKIMHENVSEENTGTVSCTEDMHTHNTNVIVNDEAYGSSQIQQKVIDANSEPQEETSDILGSVKDSLVIETGSKAELESNKEDNKAVNVFDLESDSEKEDTETESLQEEEDRSQEMDLMKEETTQDEVEVLQEQKAQEEAEELKGSEEKLKVEKLKEGIRSEGVKEMVMQEEVENLKQDSRQKETEGLKNEDKQEEVKKAEEQEVEEEQLNEGDGEKLEGRVEELREEKEKERPIKTSPDTHKDIGVFEAQRENLQTEELRMETNQEEVNIQGRSKEREKSLKCSNGLLTEANEEGIHCDKKADTGEDYDMEEMRRNHNQDDANANEDADKQVVNNGGDIDGPTMENEAVTSAQAVPQVSQGPSENRGAFGLFHNALSFFSQTSQTETKSTESTVNSDTNTDEKLQPQASLKPEQEIDSTTDTDQVYVQDPPTDSPIAMSSSSSSPSLTQPHSPAPTTVKLLSKHYPNLLGYMSANEVVTLTKLFGQHKLQFLEYILGSSDSMTDDPDNDESILLDIERLLYYHRDALFAPSMRLTDAPQEDKDKTRTVIALQKLEMLLERVKEMLNTRKSDISKATPQANASCDGQSCSSQGTHEEGTETVKEEDSSVGPDGSTHRDEETGADDVKHDSEKDGDPENDSRGEMVKGNEHESVSSQEKGVIKQILHILHQIMEGSSTHVHALWELLVWLTVQVVSSLPDDIRPGPDLYGVPWEPVIVSGLVGLVTLLVFSCRCYSSVKSRMYRSKERWMADQVAQLLDEKCKVLETLSKCQQEHDELENSLRDSGVLAQTQKTVQLEAKAKQLHHAKKELQKDLEELKDQLEHQREHRIEQEQRIAALEDVMKTCEEETKDLQSQEEQAQTTIKVYSMNSDRLQRNLETSGEENTLLKESNDQLRQQVEGWAERVSELEEEMRRCEISHSGMLQDVATKDERIMSLTDRLLRMKAWDSDLEEECEQGGEKDTSNGMAERGNRNGKGHEPDAQVHLQKVQKLIYAAKLNADLKSVDEDKDRVFAKLNNEVKAIEDLQVSIKDLEKEKISLQSDSEHYSEQVQRLQQKLQIMTEMYQENELKLHRLLTVEEKERLQKEEKLNKADRNIAMAMEELNNYKQRAEEMEEELEKTKQSYQTQISAHEKKAHNNWLAARAAERELTDIRRENALFRQKLTDTQFKLDALEKDPYALDSLARPLPFRAERSPYGPSPLGRPSSETRAFLSPPTLMDGPPPRLSPRVTRGPLEPPGGQGEMERSGGPHSDSGSISPTWERDRRGPPPGPLPGPPGPLGPPGYIFPESGGPMYRRPPPLGHVPPPGSVPLGPRGVPPVRPPGPPIDMGDGPYRENSFRPGEQDHRETGPGAPPEGDPKMGGVPPPGPPMGPMDGSFPRRAPYGPPPPDFYPPRGPGGPPMPRWGPPPPGMMFPPRFPPGGPPPPHMAPYGMSMRPPPPDGFPPPSMGPPPPHQQRPSPPHSQSPEEHMPSPQDII